ncbi:MAG: metallophosphoesterase family protein [Bacteroidetes bacterium]|nr:metallophosphoesterase family protein [Bacteroidota bacterium]MCL6100930.1 metallophosphoesterase family protein [Bacteroidota bacterium]
MRQFKFLLFLLMLAAAGMVSAQKLHFNKAGEFKILQFTDTHIDYKHGSNDPVFELIAEIVDAERPDLVMLTGDIVTREKPAEVYQRFEKLFADRKTPWSVVLGNHDEEHGSTRAEIVEMLKKFPNCLTTMVPGIKGASNFVLSVAGKDKKTKAVIYGLDSNGYSKIKDRIDGYDWFGLDQIAWYKKVSSAFTQKNGGIPVPSLAFFHIPFTEYNDAWDNKSTNHFGEKNEKISCPEINSGMFAAMVECNDVMGTFVGHDHVNDYIGLSHHIALAFGRCSGGKNAYGELPDGGRVIVLKEGERSFDTWIHEKGGKIVYRCNYPNSFITTLPKK